jgi:flagellar basal-body rod protein FlgF
LIKGLYTAASGMMLQMARQDVLANNIANVDTAGFKRDDTMCQAFPEMLISRLGEVNQDNGQPLQPVLLGKLGTGAVVDSITTDFTRGSLKETDNSTDLALGGDGFFTVQTPQGQRFTRDGEFKINDQKILTTSEGYPVLDRNNQPIVITGEDFKVDEQGNVTINGNITAALKIVNFADLKTLQKTGDNLITSSAQPTIAVNPQVKQGYIEESNVNAVKEMVDLISVVRSYESLQKMVQAEDETLSTAIDDVASVK